MDQAQIAVTTGGVALMAATLWFFFGKGSAGKSGPGPFSCPMHPWITSPDRAATCSLCGMQLVRKEDAG